MPIEFFSFSGKEVDIALSDIDEDHVQSIEAAYVYERKDNYEFEKIDSVHRNVYRKDDDSIAILVEVVVPPWSPLYEKIKKQGDESREKKIQEELAKAKAKEAEYRKYIEKLESLQDGIVEK